MQIVSEFPILQVIIPMLFAVISAMSMSTSRAIFIVRFCGFLCFGISCTDLILNTSDVVHYEIGNWDKTIGIEYTIDLSNRILILFCNAILLFLSCFCSKQIESSLIKYIEGKYPYLFYSLLLFAHSGYVGILSTNDLFNLYVFIEISSISTYVLMSIGRDKFAPANALNYLIMGTIGATFILISIGLLLSLTGSLNASIVSEVILQQQSNTPVLAGVLAFFIVGCMLKIALFPVNSWMIKVYNSTPSVLLVYTSSVSSLTSAYILMHFFRYTLHFNTSLSEVFTNAFYYTSIVAIILGVGLTLLQTTIKQILIHSLIPQTACTVLMMCVGAPQYLITIMLCVDSMSKVCLFFILSIISEEIKVENDLLSNKINRVLLLLSLFASFSLPMSAGFVMKIKSIDFMLSYNFRLGSAVLVLYSALSLIYYYRIFDCIRQTIDSNIKDKDSSLSQCLVVLVFAQIASIIVSII